MESATDIEFTTSESMTLTIAQALTESDVSTIKLDDTVLSNENAAILTYDSTKAANNHQNVKWYCKTIDAGTHHITKGTDQAFLIYLGLTSSFPDANYVVFNGTVQQGGSITFTPNLNKWAVGSSAACTFSGNAFTYSLKQESATYTKFATTEKATLTVVQNLSAQSDKTIGLTGTTHYTTKTTLSDVDNVLKTEYTTETTVDGKKYKNVRIYKIYNLPADAEYSITQGNGQSYVAYIGVTYETTPSFNIYTEISNGGSSTVDGGGSYLRGFPATLTASPGAGKAFSHWELGGENVSTDNPYTFNVTAEATYTAVFANAETKTITIASNNDTYGSADATATTISENSTTTLTATPSNVAYYFANWTKSSDGSWSSTTNPLEIAYENITDGETYTANFAAYRKITYSVGGGEKGTQTSYQYGTMTKYADKTGSITMPNNYAFVYNADFEVSMGYTLKYWNNGGLNYAAGSNYTLDADVIALQPVFVANTVSLAEDITAPHTVTWNFASNASAPDVHVEGNTGYYVVQTNIGGTTIDVPMYISGSKFNMGTTRAQVNATTNFKVPAVKGMVMTFTADSGSPAADKFETDDAGNTEYSISGKVVTITYSGTNSTLTLSVKSGDYWPKSLAITYPVSTVATTINNTYGWATLSSDKILDFSGDIANLEAAYIITGATGNSVTTQEINGKIAAGQGILLKGSGEVSIPVADAASYNHTGNLLKAGTDAAVAKEDGKSKYVLSVKDGKAVFKLINGTAPTVATGKAYLEITGGGAPVLSLDFDAATGIEQTRWAAEHATDAIYTLSGQRVSDAKKGLYIKNGRKIIVK